MRARHDVIGGCSGVSGARVRGEQPFLAMSAVLAVLALAMALSATETAASAASPAAFLLCIGIFLAALINVVGLAPQELRAQLLEYKCIL